MKTMSIEHFYDFYFLEALRAGLTMAKSAKPEIEFKHSFEKLEQDVNNSFNELTKTMAERIRLYLWAACLGEARHAHRRCEYALEHIDGNKQSRKSIFQSAKNYPITQENIEALKEVFNQNWGGDFGGQAWFTIVEAIEMYGNVSDTTFIDHSIDLEHNSGNVFTKTDAKDTVFLDNNELYNVRVFLDIKFSKDILKVYSYKWNDSFINVSTRVFNLLNRYGNIVSKVETDMMRPKLEWLDDFDVEFGDESLTVVEVNNGMSCAICTKPIDEDSHFHTPDDECICENCYDSNYGTCHECRNIVSNDDITNVDGDHLCPDCLSSSGAAQCAYCGDYVKEYIVTEDTSEAYCEYCQKHIDFCEECGKWYEHIDEHNEEEHTEEEPEFEGYNDAEGVFCENKEVDETVYQISYRFSEKTKYDAVKGKKSAQKQANTFKQVGAKDVKIEKQVLPLGYMMFHDNEINAPSVKITGG